MIIILSEHNYGYRTQGVSFITYRLRGEGIRTAGAPTPPLVTVKGSTENSAKFYKGFSLN